MKDPQRFFICCVLAIIGCWIVLYNTNGFIVNFWTPVKQNITVFHNLCIEPTNGKPKLVLYSQKRNQASTKLKIENVVSLHDRTWTFRTTTIDIPDYLIPKNNLTAYFVKFREPGNLFHFWQDAFRGTYGAMFYMNEIGVEKHIYFDGIGDIFYTFQLFFQGLKVSKYSGIDAVIKPICYKRAVFGFTSENVNNSEIVDLVITNLNLDTSHCPKDQIVIQTRQYRRITNSEDMRKYLQKNGYKNVKVLDFVTKSVREQMQIMVCTKVLVGVHGAGLEWFRFMRYPAALIEITWEQWRSLFKARALRDGYIAIELPDCQAKLSNHGLAVYAERFNLTKFTLEDDEVVQKYINESLTLPEFWYAENIWKFADCNVSVSDLLIKVNESFQEINLSF